MKPAAHHQDGHLSGPLLALICGILLLLGLGIWFYLAKRSDKPLVPDKENQQTSQATFVGSKTCAECHANIYQSYQHHPMANSLSRPSEATVIEDYQQNNSFMSGGRRYHVTFPTTPDPAEKNGKPSPQQFPQHHEKMVAADGNDIYDQSVPIAFVVGSGSRGRSYITQKHDLLFQSPITWYVEDQTWDLSPGYAPSGHQRFERKLTEPCLSCHAGKINFLDNHTDRYNTTQPFQELAIGCERCHGPGKKHVDAHRQGLVTSEQHIVNPQKLASRERNSVCYQCHLSGKHRVLRYGKRARDFQPGQAMRDIWTVFVSGTGINQHQARLTSNVEQLHASRCFQESNGQMGCTSCHDAHYSPKPEERSAYYRTRCLSCHQDQDCSLPAPQQAAAPALNSCTFCHMQKLTTSDIAHSSQADHRILKVSSQDPAEDTKREPAMTRKNEPRWEVFDHALEGLPSWDANRALAIGTFHEAMARGDEKPIRQARNKLTQVVKRVPKDHAARYELAQMHYRLKNYDQALAHIRIVLKENPTHENALTLAGYSSQFNGQLQNGIEYFQRKLTLNPWESNLYIPLAEMVGKQQDLHNAIKILRQALQVDPSSILLHTMIADYYDRVGNNRESQRHLKLIESIRYSMQRDQ